MFTQLQGNFRMQELHFPNFETYLARHIEIDGDDHGPLAELMIQELCDTEQKYQEAYEVAKDAIEMRVHLWNGILRSL
jgi:hypothetical protein